MIQFPREGGGQQPAGVRDDVPTCSEGSKLSYMSNLLQVSHQPLTNAKNRRQSVCSLALQRNIRLNGSGQNRRLSYSSEEERFRKMLFLINLGPQYDNI